MNVEERGYKENYLLGLKMKKWLCRMMRKGRMGMVLGLYLKNSIKRERRRRRKENNYMLNIEEVL